MVAAYKVSLVGEIIGHLMIKIRSVILANIVLGEDVVPQFIQRECTPQSLAAALLPLFSDTPERHRQVEAFARLDGIMEIGKAVPSDRAAAVTLGCAARFNQIQRETVASGPPRA
jgi:lipid-A-disaccharide synthase